MAIVFVVVSNGDTDTRLIFAALGEMVRRFRAPDRPLHFEETLMEVMGRYNVDLSDSRDEHVEAVLLAMENTPTVKKETIELGVPLSELGLLGLGPSLIIPSPKSSKSPMSPSSSGSTEDMVELEHLMHVPPGFEEITQSPQSGSGVIAAVILCAVVSVILVVFIIFWSVKSARSSSTHTPERSDSF